VDQSVSLQKVNESGSVNLIVEVLGYKLDDSGFNDPMGDILAVRALQPPANFDNSRGIMTVMMAGPLDGESLRWNGNRVIRDLLNGSDEYKVPRCGVGSVVLLRSCVPMAEGMMSAGSYSVVEVCPEVDLDDKPDPVDKFKGEWLRPTGEALVADDVVEFTRQLLTVLLPGR
jgi:hypothetical protein